MPTVKLPFLEADASIGDLMQSLAKHRAPGAVVKFGKNYGLVTVTDARHLFDRDETISIAGVGRTKLSHGDISDIVGAWARIAVDADLGTRLSTAPLYVCPSGDQASSSPGECTFHHVPLERVEDDE